MSEQQKATEIFNEYFFSTKQSEYEERKQIAKKNALICANIILNEYRRGFTDLSFINVVAYWEGVVYELEKK